MIWYCGNLFHEHFLRSYFIEVYESPVKSGNPSLWRTWAIRELWHSKKIWIHMFKCWNDFELGGQAQSKTVLQFFLGKGKILAVTSPTSCQDSPARSWSPGRETALVPLPGTTGLSQAEGAWGHELPGAQPPKKAVRQVTCTGLKNQTFSLSNSKE